MYQLFPIITIPHTPAFTVTYTKSICTHMMKSDGRTENLHYVECHWSDCVTKEQC